MNGHFSNPFYRKPGCQSAYDFPLFTTIREAFGFGGSLKTLVDPGAYGNALPWYRAVTFVVTHDIPHNNGFRYAILDPQDEHLAYAYVLGRDGGAPLIYSDHKESPFDGDRWFEAYKRPDIAAMIQFHNAVQGEEMVTLYESDTLLIFRRGHLGIVAINKSTFDQWAEFNTWGLKNPGTYQDLIHRHEMTLSGNRFTLFVPPRSAQMWLVKN